MQIRVDITATEAINGLLGIADHHQQAAQCVVLCAITIDRIENVVLLRVGVLELVDQRDRPTLKQRVGQRRARIVQRACDTFNQCIKGDLSACSEALLALFTQRRLITGKRGRFFGIRQRAQQRKSRYRELDGAHTNGRLQARRAELLAARYTQGLGKTLRQ